MIEVELPDGSIAEFPDTMSDDEITAVLQRQFGQPQASQPDLVQDGIFAGLPSDIARQIEQDIPMRTTSPSPAAVGMAMGGPATQQLIPGLSEAEVMRQRQERANLERLKISRPDLFELAQETGPIQAAAVGAGETTAELIRGAGKLVGADLLPKDETSEQALTALRSERPVSTTVGTVGAEVGTFAIPAAKAAKLPSAAQRAAALSGVGAVEGGVLAAGRDLSPEQIAISATVGAVLGATPEVAPVIAKSIHNRIQQSTMSSLSASGFGLKSAGAAQTPQELQRILVSKNMPVPFEDGSELTKGQALRAYELLQFEKEKAKLSNVGEPLRRRIENQSETLMMNFDALADLSEPVRRELRDIGRSVDEALVKRHDTLKKRVDNLYEAARRDGELQDLVSMQNIPGMLEDIERFEGVAPNAKAIRKEAQRLGIVDDNLNANNISLEDAEFFRSFVNLATDITNPQQARIRRIAISAIDESMENAGGELFQRARRARAEMARELENVGITKRLMSTKKGTDERSIAYEDVFKKIILDSPREEMNKLRGTLLRAGDEGKQAWADLKAKGVEYIKENAQSLTASDSRGNPILSPNKLNSVIKSMDDRGKLESLYGKKNAQIIRDLGELSNVIFTAPPGAINHSDTSSAIFNFLDWLGGTMGGAPAPVTKILKSAVGQIQGEQLKKQIREHLNYVSRQ